MKCMNNRCLSCELVKRAGDAEGGGDSRRTKPALAGAGMSEIKRSADCITCPSFGFRERSERTFCEPVAKWRSPQMPIIKLKI
jgi:hypothetical protein